MANIIEVSALNRYVKALLEEDVFLTDIAIKGEISNFSRNRTSGHCYFTLSDKKSSVRAVMFRSAADGVSFKLEDGISVLARCRVSLYERDGAFQINVDHMFKDGLGLMQLAFDELKEKLAADGLFAQEHKKALPQHPKTIGLVTSKTGAALQDILKVAAGRCPAAHFVLAHASVQGQKAAPEIIAAIKALDAHSDIDVIIVARGGGSAEDLSVFNSEDIARAVFACAKPVVSAIGHEIDFSILDFVADFRAPTPSAAAETVLPDMYSLHANVLMRIYAEIQKSMQAKLDMWYNDIQYFKENPVFEAALSLPALYAEKLGNLAGRMENAQQAKLSALNKQLENSAALAHSLSPYAVLSRGYAYVTDDAGSKISTEKIAKNSKIEVHLQRTTLECTVQKTRKNNLAGN